MKINTRGMRRLILKLYKENPKVADDDKLLIAKVWQEEGWYNDLTLEQNLRRVSSPETIRRTRQKLRQEGLIKVSEATDEARYRDFQQARMMV